MIAEPTTAVTNYFAVRGYVYDMLKCFFLENRARNL